MVAYLLQGQNHLQHQPLALEGIGFAGNAFEVRGPESSMAFKVGLIRLFDHSYGLSSVPTGSKGRPESIGRKDKYFGHLTSVSRAIRKVH
jgi:hypothetical protein